MAYSGLHSDSAEVCATQNTRGCYRLSKHEKIILGEAGWYSPTIRHLKRTVVNGTEIKNTAKSTQ